ncbi:MAG: hypothetical protein V4584_05865 [Verrucomicrobiota bacterium]
MKSIILCILAIALTLVACGPNKAKLNAELGAVEGEMISIQNAASRYEAEMGKAGVNAVFGLLAGAQGLDNGNYREAAQGANSAIDAGYDADLASKSLDQLKQRYGQLATRRAEILKLLN